MSILDQEARRTILGLLRDGEKTAGDLARLLGRPRPGVSHHLSALLVHGLVSCRQNGAQRIYSLEVPAVLAAWNAYVRSPNGVEMRARSGVT
jgi:DNA-binding transcriptional ArsR family regulator